LRISNRVAGNISVTLDTVTVSNLRQTQGHGAAMILFISLFMSSDTHSTTAGKKEDVMLIKAKDLKVGDIIDDKAYPEGRILVDHCGKHNDSCLVRGFGKYLDGKFRLKCTIFNMGFLAEINIDK
jgi:hypothetical protein